MKTRVAQNRITQMFGVLSILALLIVTTMPASAAPPTGMQTRPNAENYCTCVVYTLSYLGLSPQGGRWSNSDAKDLASDEYWSADGFNRYHSRDAQASDVIIFQPGASFIVWTPQGWKWGSVDSTVGHIGIVVAARYYADYGAWNLTVRSAAFYTENGQFSDSGCDNVTDVQMWVPSGSNVTFWRAYWA